MAVTLTVWHKAIVDTIRDEFAVRAQQLAQAGGEEPWNDMVGNDPTKIEAPAVFIVPFRFDVDTSEQLIGRNRTPDWVMVTWQAFHILRTSTSNLSTALFEMANITRAIVHDRSTATPREVGNLWGLTDTKLPEVGMSALRVDLGLNGHACVMLEWRQGAFLVNSLLET